MTISFEVAERLGPEALAAVDRRLRPFRAGRTSSPDVRILLGDQPLPTPPGPGRTVYESPAGPVRYDDDEGSLFADHRGGAQLRCDAAIGMARLSCRPSCPDSLWLAVHPLLTLALIELLKSHRRFSLHAACVASADRGILIAGPSGAGKTTLAVVLARSGLAFMADDMVFLAPARGGLDVLAFADEVDVTDQTMSMFEELRPAARPQLAGGEKWSLRLEDALDTPTGRTCRPALLILARVAHRDSSRMVSVTATEALVDLAPNVLLTDAGSARAHLAVLAQLAETTPCIRLETGRDLDRLPWLVREVLDSLGS